MSGLKTAMPESKASLRKKIDRQVDEYLKSGGSIREFEPDVFGQPYSPKRLTRQQNLAKLKIDGRVVRR